MDLPIGKVKCGKISVWKNDYRIVVKNLGKAIRKISNNRFNLANPLSRSLQEQQCKLRAKPSLRSGADLKVKRMLDIRAYARAIKER
jgi:hypothetical protein